MSNGIKVCITGNVDELFAGYYHHFSFFIIIKKKKEKKISMMSTKFIKPLIRNKEYKNLNNKKL